MNDDAENKDRERSQGMAPMAYIRSTPVGTKISLGVLTTLAGLLVTVFGFLLSGYRDAQAQLNSAFTTYAAANQSQHQTIWNEIQDIELFFCSKFPNWKKCR